MKYLKTACLSHFRNALRIKHLYVVLYYPEQFSVLFKQPWYMIAFQLSVEEKMILTYLFQLSNFLFYLKSPHALSVGFGPLQMFYLCKSSSVLWS